MATSSCKLTRIFSFLLAAVLCLSIVLPLACTAKAENYLDGDWEKVSIQDGNRKFNVYAFRLDNKLYNCSSFDLEIDVSMRENSHCYDWKVWVGDGNSFEYVTSIPLTGGNGYASKTVKISPARSFDYVAITPTATGGYTWSLSMDISNAKTSSYTGNSNSSSSSYSDVDALSGDWEKVRLGNSNTYAFVLDTTLRKCTRFSLDYDVTLNAGAKCEKWQVWGGYNGSYTKLDTFYLSGGSGSISTTVWLPNAMTIDSIAVTPVKQGNYTYSFELTVYDPHCK